MRDPAKITAFLKGELASGPVPVKLLQEQALAAGLIEQGKRIWQTKAWRTAARKLKVKHVQDKNGWLWMLPPVRPPAAPAQVQQQEPDAPPVSAAAPDPLPDAPVPEPDDLVAARRKFMEESMRGFEEMCRKADQEAKVTVARYLQTGDLADLFPAES